MQLRHQSLFAGFAIFLVGIVVGGCLFSHVQPRSILNLSQCQGNCYRSNDVAGLIAENRFLPIPREAAKLAKTLTNKAEFAPQDIFALLSELAEIRAGKSTNQILVEAA